MLERHYGPEHIKVTSTLGELARTLMRFGEASRAKDLEERVLAMGERHFGPGSFQLADAVCDLVTLSSSSSRACGGTGWLRSGGAPRAWAAS